MSLFFFIYLVVLLHCLLCVSVGNYADHAVDRAWEAGTLRWRVVAKVVTSAAAAVAPSLVRHTCFKCARAARRVSWESAWMP